MLRCEWAGRQRVIHHLMKAIDPRVELVPSAFHVPFAECFDLFFTGVRGARIHAKYLRHSWVPAVPTLAAAIPRPSTQAASHT